MLDCNIFPGLGQDYLDTEVNMFLLPMQENDGEDNLTKAGDRELNCWSSCETKLNFYPLCYVRHELIIVHCLGLGTYPLFSLLPGYRGHPAFSTMVSKLRSQILAMPRCQLSHTILTEKNW